MKIYELAGLFLTLLVILGGTGHAVNNEIQGVQNEVVEDYPADRD